MRKVNLSTWFHLTTRSRSDFFYNLYMGQSIQEWTKLNFWKTAFKKFKGCLSQILFGPFLNTLSDMISSFLFSAHTFGCRRFRDMLSPHYFTFTSSLQIDVAALHFLNKYKHVSLHVSHETYRRSSNTGTFLWILRNF